MADEEGQFSGPKPTVFRKSQARSLNVLLLIVIVGFDASVFNTSMFGATDLDASSTQFGADQVIIVRDVGQKKRLREKIGKDFALILTVLESKGMEFEDVLLFDFFTTSECTAAFRAAFSNNFDPAKHIVSTSPA